MKLYPICLALVFLAAAAFAADPAPSAPASGKPELHGLVTSGDSVQFLLTEPGSDHAQWCSVGDTIGDWKLATYRKQDGVLVLQRPDHPDLELSLIYSPAAAAEEHATLAQAQDLLKKMNYSQMMKRIFAQQKAAMMAMTRQALVRRGLTGDALDAALEKQTKVMDAVWGAMDSSTMEDDIAKIYSDVFTLSELSALSDFYSTPTGQALIDKTPEVQQKTMQLLMPRIMQAAAAARGAPAPAGP